MAQRRTERTTSIEYGKRGLAKCVKLDANRARFDFEDGATVTLNVVQGNVFENAAATLPDNIPFKAMKDNSFLNVRVSFEKGDKKVLFINPASGELKVKFVKFQAPEGSEPVWEEKEGTYVDKQTGKKKTFREANPFVQVVEGRWTGTVIRGRLFDNFGKDDEDGNTTIFFGKKGTSSQNLSDFCDCVGFEYWNEPYTENNLPTIQRVALENDNVFSIMMVNGYISNWVMGLNEEDTFEKDYPTNTEPASPAEALLED